MKIYHYNECGYFCGQDIADESPLEPGVYLIPAYATDQEPPVAGENQLVKFVDGVWMLENIPVPEQIIESEPTAEELLVQKNTPILAQIAELESQQTDRRVREAVLGVDSGWLANLNNQIATLRAQLL